MSAFQYGRLFYGSANVVWDTGDKEADKQVMADLRAAIPKGPGVQQAPSAISMLNVMGAQGWEVVHVAANGAEAILKRPLVIQQRTVAPTAQTLPDQSVRQPTPAKVP